MPTTIISENTAGRDFTGVEETRIAPGAATTNFGNEAVNEVDGGSTLLIRFPGLSNIVGPVNVSSATLRLSIDVPTGTSITMEFYRLLRNWVELEATNNIYSTGNSWASAGALGSGTDVASGSSGTVNLTTGAADAYADFTCTAGMRADIQGWINSGSNHGWRVTPVLEGMNVNTSEQADGLRPILSVTYTNAVGQVIIVSFGL